MQKYSLKPIPATKNHNFEQGKCLATQKEGRRKRREGRGEREEERVQRRECRGESAECRVQRGERRGEREEGRGKGAEGRVQSGEGSPPQAAILSQSCHSVVTKPACAGILKNEKFISPSLRGFLTPIGATL